MTFEEWLAGYQRKEQLWAEDMQAAWDAATYAANNRAGDASNEAEKDERRKVAVEKLDAIKFAYVADADFMKEADAIIKKAQG